MSLGYRLRALPLFVRPTAQRMRAFIGWGNTEFSEDVNYARFIGGVRGDLGFFKDWRYDLNFYYGNNDSHASFGPFFTDRVFNSLVVVPAAPGTPAALTATGLNGQPYMCAITATNPGYGCVPAPAPEPTLFTSTTMTGEGHAQVSQNSIAGSAGRGHCRFFTRQPASGDGVV